MKKVFIIAAVAISSTFLTAGLVYAASHDITGELGGVSGDMFNLDGAMAVDSLIVGAQNVGGVTFFNGTIINNTTNGSADNPVTFGDNVRIDGRVYRGSAAGTADTMPFIVNDNMQVAGSLEVGSFASEGVVDTANLADGAVSQAAEDFETNSVIFDAEYPDYDVLLTKTITTGDSTLLVLFSGEFQGTNTGEIVTWVTLDGGDSNILMGSMRGMDIHTAHASSTISSNNIVAVEAGTHTIQVRAAISDSVGTMGDMSNGTLDVIELKK
ncbi:MAG: hypothetical protein PHY34_04820 [Patescibacteria group bacterium]|nr:hypothetical protein [Patescibacteria group bacterium]MDD5715608.1 hypothetical protein [Patescibacteria group bacterium]